MTEQQKAEIYEQFSSKVLHYIQSRVCDSYLAEDLCSEVFVKIYDKLGSYDPDKSALSTWVFTIARNTLTDYYRTRRITEEIPETLACAGSFEDDICRDEMLETLADALESLDSRSREIIVLRYYSGMTLKAISERLGISYAYIKVLHNKALAALKKYF